jgi:hypothetical protein
VAVTGILVAAVVVSVALVVVKAVVAAAVGAAVALVVVVVVKKSGQGDTYSEFDHSFFNSVHMHFCRIVVWSFPPVSATR